MSISSLADPAIMSRYLSVVKGGTMIGRLPDLQEQVQSQAATIVALQKEVADLRVTVARLEQIVLRPASNNKNANDQRMPSFL
jgi:hypothetical protein